MGAAPMGRMRAACVPAPLGRMQRAGAAHLAGNAASSLPWHDEGGRTARLPPCTLPAALCAHQCPRCALQSILSDRLRINGSLARAAIKELHSKGLIKPVVLHSAQQIYTRATGA